MPVDEERLEQRRQSKLVLKELRSHLTQVEEDREEVTDCRSDALKDHLERAKGNIEKSQTVEQSLLDAQIYRSLAECAGKQAEQLQAGLKTYDVKSFLECLLHPSSSTSNVNSLGNEGMVNFANLGGSIMGNFRTVPSIDFLYGNEIKENEDEQQQKKQLERKSRQARKEKNVVKPNELRSDQVEQTETDKQVKIMKKELQRRRQCNFWTFVIDPNDFTRSVENLFHSSFLIKESWAELDLNADPPVFKYREHNDDEEQNESNGGGDGHSNIHANGDGSGGGNSRGIASSEYIMAFDPMTWQEMINKYDITTCVLPRNYHASQNHQNDPQFQEMLQYEEEEHPVASF